MKKNPMVIPMTGDRTMKVTTKITVEILMAAIPDEAIPAPKSPPMMAWEEEVGRPSHQVMRFHPMAPMRAARCIQGMELMGTKSSLTRLLMVLATATPKAKAATKLKTAAKRTACLGERTLVDTTVEMAFAESWKPFVKSKARATRMMRPMMRGVGEIMAFQAFPTVPQFTSGGWRYPRGRLPHPRTCPWHSPGSGRCPSA